jgi:RNA polymerase sigma factor (sigma-70 family)
MTRESSNCAFRQLETLFRVGTLGGLTDAELLDRFLDRTDGTDAEAAFTALVERHGPMVLRVCRGALRDPHNAEDAFQATFLILVERAGSIRRRASLASWLFGVAGRVARRATADAARRRAHEFRRAAMRAKVEEATVPDDLGPILHEEVDRLPETYRAAVVLCDLEGQSHESAARQLRWPLGTLKTRLARGRARLRKQLLGRGLAVAGLASGTANAQVPAALSRATVRNALAMAAGQARGAVLSTSVIRLVEGVLGEFVRARIGMAVLLGTLLTLGAAQVSRSNRLAASDEPRPLVAAVAIAPNDETAAIELIGRTVYDPDTLTRIRPRFPGRIEKVHVTLGQKVRKGDPLIEIDSPSLAKAKTALQTKWLQWQHDKRLLELREKLRKTGAISEQVWIDTQNDEKKSRLDSQLALDLLRIYKVPEDVIDALISGLEGKTNDPAPLGNLEEKARLTFRSPVDATVIERTAIAGRDFVEAETLIVLAPGDHLWVVAGASEKELEKIRIGQRCDIFVPQEDGIVRGLVEAVSDRLGRKTRQYKIRIRIPNPEGRLKADMIMRVRVVPDPEAAPPRPPFESRFAPRQ